MLTGLLVGGDWLAGGDDWLEAGDDWPAGLLVTGLQLVVTRLLACWLIGAAAGGARV